MLQSFKRVFDYFDIKKLFIQCCIQHKDLLQHSNMWLIYISLIIFLELNFKREKFSHSYCLSHFKYLI